MTSKSDKRVGPTSPRGSGRDRGGNTASSNPPSHVASFPVAADPLAAIADEVGDALAGTDVDELQAEARSEAAREVADERDSEDGA